MAKNKILITQSEFARRQKFSRQYVSKLVRNGTVILRDGKVDPEQAMEALALQRNPARQLGRYGAAGHEDPHSKEDQHDQHDQENPHSYSGNTLTKKLTLAKLKSEIERGQLLTLERKYKTGQLLDADEVRKAARDSGRENRAAWESWPSRMSGEIAAELGGDPRKVRITLERFVNLQLLELSGDSDEDLES
ncbi:MAG: hypothetical protein HQL75_00350 [Magnetococcales bacterium]|nr:hypothetical protein [Magnetococcales bacterium]